MRPDHQAPADRSPGHDDESVRRASREFDRRLVLKFLLVGLVMWAAAGSLWAWDAVTCPESYGPAVYGALLAIGGSAMLLIGTAFGIAVFFSRSRHG